jgi:hypothetical protein
MTSIGALLTVVPLGVFVFTPPRLDDEPEHKEQRE